jgi:hypothetical protein
MMRMNKIETEERELIDQQRKIFEAGAQRADKRTGSFSFLTWSFFIAPVIAGEESTAATLKFAPAEEENAKVVQASATPQATRDDSPASDLSKISPEDEIARQPVASLEARAAQLDPTGLLTQLAPENAPKPSIAKNEPVAAAGGGGGGGGGGDDADSRSHDGHISIDHSPVNWLAEDSHLGSDQLPGWSMLDSIQSDVLSIGSAPFLGTVSPLTNDIVGTIGTIETTAQPALATISDNVEVVGMAATLEATVQPVLATTTDTAGAIADGVVGTVATLEAAAQPVLATVSDIAGTIANDALGTIATAETTLQPMLATMSETVGTLANDVVGTIATVESTVQPVLATVSDTVGTLANDVAGTIAPAEAAAQTLLTAGTDAALPAVADVLSLDVPVASDLADAAHLNQQISEVQSATPDSAGTIVAELGGTALNALDPIVTAGSNDNPANDPLHAADPHAPTTAGAIVDGIDAALAPATGSDADPSGQAVAETSHVAAAHIGSSVLVSAAPTPLLPEFDDGSQAAAPEIASGPTDNAVASAAAPVVDTADPLLVAMSGAASQVSTSSQTAASDSAASHPPGSSASAADVADTASVTGTDVTGAAAQPGNVAADAVPNVAPAGDTADEPVLASTGLSLNNPSANQVEDTNTGQAGAPADTLLALATATDAPITTAAPASVAADVSNTTTVADTTAITGDVIALNDAPTPSANSLFSGSQYTDYGVTLTSDIVVAQQPTVSPVDTASAHDSLVPVVGDVQQPTPSPTDVDTTHSIDHLGLRDAIL